MEPPTPEVTSPTEDVGADTGARFAYQDAWAATLACALLSEPPPITDVWCEHHEDILLKQPDGLFHGVQVKTRESGVTGHLKTSQHGSVQNQPPCEA